MTARPALVTEVTDAWAGLTIDERLWVSQRGSRMLRLYIAVDALAAESLYVFSLDAVD